LITAVRRYSTVFHISIDGYLIVGSRFIIVHRLWKLLSVSSPPYSLTTLAPRGRGIHLGILVNSSLIPFATVVGASERMTLDDDVAVVERTVD